MTVTMTKEIKRYAVWYYGGGKRTAQPYLYRAIVGLYDTSSLVAALYFIDDPNAMPAGDNLPNTGQPMSFYPMTEFPRIIDLLRNEGPVYYQQLASWPGMASISTSLEPVAEGEPKPA